VSHTVENPTHIITHQWGHSYSGFPNSFLYLETVTRARNGLKEILEIF